jgi:hypothetical protein
MAIADHFQMLALQVVLDIAFDVFGSDHTHLLSPKAKLLF